MKKAFKLIIGIILSMSMVISVNPMITEAKESDIPEEETTVDPATVGTVYYQDNKKGGLKAYFSSDDKMNVTYNNKLYGKKKRNDRYVYIYIYRDSSLFKEYGKSVLCEGSYTRIFTTGKKHSYKIEAYQYDGPTDSSSCIDRVVMTF